MKEKVQKEDLLRRIGNISQLAYARRSRMEDGTADGCKVITVANGGGLAYTVIEGKGLNLLNFSYRGTNLSFISKPGLAAPAFFNPHNQEFPRNFQAGMLFTCGLLNVGPASIDEGMELSQHGRIGQLPAENVSINTDWEGDDYFIRISGEVREAALYRENLLLKRSIVTKYGSKTVTLHDIVENQGFEPQPFMVLYHINIGYPLLDEAARLIISDKGVIAHDAISENGKDKIAEFCAPIDNCPEQLFCHDVCHDSSGRTLLGLINDELGIGLAIQYDTGPLPYLVEWKSMRSGDYALGIEPANCTVNTRAKEREMGTLQTIRPFEKVAINLELTALDGPDEISNFEARVKALGQT
ncbi:MAG: aldose 1-epimerase family protein [Spirochaetaceae bacterium]|nr:aldose 1-epimerase family protein [Spirochaetaceae bacterium]